MYCKNCGSEIEKDEKFCTNCGYDSIESSHDLECVTKISTPLFILFNILTLGIYSYIKWYRMTGDLRKILNREETVSPCVITAWIILVIMGTLRRVFIDPVVPDDTQQIYGLFLILSGIVNISLYCHILYHTLENIRKIARIKQNKDLKYNKFWAFLFWNIYINFVFNTYDQRLVEDKK